MMTKGIQKIIVANDTQLRNEHYYKRLWMAVKNVSITRRRWLDEISDTLRDYGGVITDHQGRSWVIGDVDDIFGDDPDMRWMGYYLKTDASGDQPYSQCRKIKRLQLLDIYFKIKHPNIARHFAK